MTQTEVIARLDKAKIANASVNEMTDVWNHPQLQARQRWVDVDTPIGKVPTLKPVGLKDSNDFVINPVPSLGQHSEKNFKGARL